MQTGIEMRLAVLIDADNIPHDRLSGMMKEIARYGTPTIKRIYGDWTKPDLRGWKNLLLMNALTPIQQYRYTVGKNATDSAMIIEAMDMLYAGNVDGFFIVSSDSDFTRLALRLRESGKRVFGMGERKTPKPFIVACDKFIYIEIIDVTTEKPEQEVPAARHLPSRPAKPDQNQPPKSQILPKPDSGRPQSIPAAPASVAVAAAPTVVVPETKPQENKPVETVIHKDAAHGRNRRRKPGRPETKAEVAAAAMAASQTAAIVVEPEHAASSPAHVEPVVAETAHVTAPVAVPEGGALVETVTQEIVDLIASSVNDLADENGWAFLGDVGTLIAKKQPDFDPRNYGFMKLTPLVRSLDAFELDIRETSQYHIKHVYIRNKERK